MGKKNNVEGQEPIAIVGMACRFADNSSSPSKLWDMLKEGRSGQSDVPKNRFNIDTWFHPRKGRPGSMYSRGGYFLGHDNSYRDFDPSFFGISPLEATSMDPQQRKLLEVVYECFESAGKSLEDVSGSETGCYVGCFNIDYDQIQTKDPEYSIPYQSTGSGLTILSNRVNYTFNLKGPSLTVDTACSSSLYALHLACQSLLSDDCTAALVGGSSLIASIEKHIGSGRLGILSPSSTCHTFDSSADGFGRGDGIAALYLKRLSVAVADGDPIRAVIRATAINSNGRGLGISHPGSEAQQAVIRKAYERANLDFGSTGYFECHGTGTPVGDPIECMAIGNIFAEGRSVDEPLLIGSVKTNLGHCEGASGLAAIIKAVLCLEEGLIPPTVGIKNLNPNIDFKDGKLQVVRELTSWPDYLRYRRISVNGFGFGGANAHAILDGTESYLGHKRSSGTDKLSIPLKRAYLLPFSAHDEATLKLNINAIFKVKQDYDLSDLAYTLLKRSHFRSRAFSICKDETCSTETQDGNVNIGILANTVPNIAFVFTGQGAQWPQMGYTLMQQYPLFSRTIEKLDNSLSLLPSPPDFTIREVISRPKGTSTIYHSIRSPVCCTAIQVALTTLLASWGIVPTAVVGHSAGEIAAAFAAGYISGTEAVAIAYYRGLAVLNCKEDGAMLAVGLGSKEVHRFIEGQPDVIIGCYNSPKSVTLSGGEHSIEEIRLSLVDSGIFSRKVNSSGNAYHSHLMRSASKEFQNLFESTYFNMIRSAERDVRLPRKHIYSCITGNLLEIDEIPFTHWQKNLESPVLFDQATELLVTSEPGVNHLLEIGAHSALAGPIRQIIAGLGLEPSKLKYISSLIRYEDGVDNMLQLAGDLFNLGYPVNIERINSEQYVNNDGDIHTQGGKLAVNLPSYQWNYDSLLWNDTRWSREQRFRTHCRHDILGSREPGGSQSSPLWRNHLATKDVPWLLDHKIGDNVIFPGAGYIAMAIEALTQVAEYRDIIVPCQGYTISGLKIISAMIIPSGDSIETLFNLRELQDGNGDKSALFDFCISSVRTDGKWSDHAKGRISLLNPINSSDKTLPATKRVKSLNNKSWYTALSTVGVEFGPAFQAISNIWSTADACSAIADINLQTTLQSMQEESRYIMHPTAIDGCMQLSVMAAHGEVKAQKAYLPVSVGELTIWTPATSEIPAQNATIHARGDELGLRSVHGAAEVYGSNGTLLLEGNFSFLSLEGGLKVPEIPLARQPYFRFQWKPDFDRLGPLYCKVPDYLSNAAGSPSEVDKLSVREIMEFLAHTGRYLKILSIGCNSITSGETFEAQHVSDETLSSGEVTKVAGSNEYSLLEDILKSLHQNSTRPNYDSFTIVDRDCSALERTRAKLGSYQKTKFCILDIDEALVDQHFVEEAYDCIIISKEFDTDHGISKALENCMRLLKPSGKLLIDLNIRGISLPTTWFTHLDTAGFRFRQRTGNPPPSTMILEKPTATLENSINLSDPVWLIYLEEPHDLVITISSIANSNGIATKLVSLRNEIEQVPARARIILAPELETPVLAYLQSKDLSHLQYLIKNASSAIWVTNGGLLNGNHPEKSLASGISKTMRTEQPSLRLSTYDINPQETCLTRSATYILDQHIRLQHDDISELEMDLIESDGLVCISRLVPEDVENTRFDQIVNPIFEDQPFLHGMELDFRRVGHIDSFYYKPPPQISTNRGLQPGEILLEPELYFLSAKEAAVLKGQHNSEFFSHEVIGKVCEIGPGVPSLNPGDRVIALHPGKLESSPVILQDSCFKPHPQERLEDMIGLLLPLCTVTFALENLLRLKKSDVVLVHIPSDPLLAIMFTQSIRSRVSKVITTYTQDSEAEYLENIQSPGICLIELEQSSWLSTVGEMIAGKGLSAIITSVGAERYQDVWNQLGKNGQYLLLGDRTDIPELSNYSQSVFARGGSFVSLDMLDIFRGAEEDIKQIIRDAVVLFRSGVFCSLPEVEFFDISHIPSAVTKTENSSRTVLRCSTKSIVPVRVIPQPLILSPEVSYLLIGCLGGLGRSLIRWMLGRGARNFIFLSRSGAEKLETRRFLEELDDYSTESSSNKAVTYKLVRGDVSVRTDVDRAISAARFPIRGVIQAAAVFKESLFENMTVETFNSVLQPKMQGTINLHEALLNEPLEFFVMTSSTLGIKGPATESSYAAANSFLDSMARHRWSLGMQATSLALGMVQEVGHIEEHPEIEAAFVQNGLYGINEAEFHIMMEMACRPRDHKETASTNSPWNTNSSSHIVTGLEVNRMKTSPNLINFALQDKRLRHLPFAAPRSEATANASQDVETASILDDAFKSGGQTQVKDAVKDILFASISRSVMVPIEKLELGISRPLADFGMDSMVSSEIRSIAWREFKADIPFMKVLDKGLLIGELLDLVWEGMDPVLKGSSA
ncbi:KR domain-containing protein [Phlyctema vagabunda]|uniref:KR domain-containing protein n=1 Tax=Phlyctema vagabunda TaxID=108571 RepID=A0ABR4P813_9HELO